MPPIRRRRRPLARAAVVGGAAYAGSKAGERKGRQAVEAEQATPQAGAPAGAAYEDDKLEQLKKLGELRDSGVLSEEEFETQKRKSLEG